MTAGIPNEILSFGMPLAGLTALIPFYIALSKCRSFREAGLCTSLFMGSVHITSSFWLSNFKEYAILTIGASSAWYFVTGYLTGLILYIPFCLTSSGEGKLKDRSGSSSWSCITRILFFASAWTLNEWCKSTGFLAYPWGTLILTAWKWKLLVQIVALTGTWGLSFLFSLFAATASELLNHLAYRQHKTPLFRKPMQQPVMNAVLFTVSLFALSLAYGTYQYLMPRVPVKTLNTVLVQHNADSWEDSEEYCIEIAEKLTENAIETSGKKPDLVVWSEGFLTYSLPDSWWYYEQIPYDLSLADHIIETGAPFIIGAPVVLDEDKFEYGNSAVLFNTDGQMEDYYAKIHLVPFAEGIPFADQIWMQKFMQLVAGFSRGWASGKEYRLFTIQGSEPVLISAPVCFEDAFPSICRPLFLAGSEVFMNITNDSWSEKASSEYQHYVIASYRALEFRTTLVRSTNGGYTTVTDPAGRILADLPLFVQDSILTEIPVYEREMTTYAILGDWLPLMLLAVLILYFIQFLYSNHSLNINTKNSYIETNQTE